MSGGPSPEVWDDKYGFEVFWIDHHTLDETIRTVPECMSDGERLACSTPRLFEVGPCEDSVIGVQKRTLRARITVFSPLEAILAMTKSGGEAMDLPDELGQIARDFSLICS